jgi:hypothetical protein
MNIKSLVIQFEYRTLNNNEETMAMPFSPSSRGLACPRAGNPFICLHCLNAYSALETCMRVYVNLMVLAQPWLLRLSPYSLFDIIPISVVRFRVQWLTAIDNRPKPPSITQSRVIGCVNVVPQ